LALCARYTDPARIVIPAAHEPSSSGPAERDPWLLSMRRALEDEEIEPSLAELLMEAFHQMAEMCRTGRDR